jgi:hypothetical protein
VGDSPAIAKVIGGGKGMEEAGDLPRRWSKTRAEPHTTNRQQRDTRRFIGPGEFRRSEAGKAERGKIHLGERAFTGPG